MAIDFFRKQQARRGLVQGMALFSICAGGVASYEVFLPVRQAGFAEVLRGVALTPGTPVTGSY